MAGIERPHRHETLPGWHSMLNGVTWEHDEALHSDAFVGDMARRWISHWPARKPLFLEIGFPGPHEPYDPPKRLLDLYSSSPVPQAHFRDGELADKPPQIEAHQEHFRLTAEEESVIDLRIATQAQIADMRRHYYANITLIDEKVGAILDQLERSGLLSNSVIIFTSDHGDNLGDHRLPYKWVMSEPVVNIPLIIADFRRAPSPRCDASLVSQIDLGPTVLEWSGLHAPDFLDGRSLAGAIAAGHDAGGDRVHCEDNYQIMARTIDRKLVYFIDQSYGEFYDLVSDPHELENLWDRLERRTERDGMLVELLGWHARSVYFNSPYKVNRIRNKRMRWPSDPLFDAKLHRTTRQVPRAPDSRQTATPAGGPARPTP
jgi:arylsulfatase A-like enzyme